MQGLKSKLKSRVLKLLDVAMAVGVRDTTVSMWENGKSFPRKPALVKLCEFFNCKVDDLM